ncbi:MAG: hypothetical protein ACRD4V_11525 [Candidatus Acidiferrales bacterium]
MESKGLRWVPYIGVLALMVSIGTLAEAPAPVHLRGVINDYPVSTDATGTATGPWELRGPWSLELHPRSATADFSAALTMEISDLTVGAGAITDTRRQHTHHISMTGATAVENPPQSDCPTGITPYPTYTWQLEVTGMATVAGNGGSPFGMPVPLQVCIGGGPDIEYSNITLVFAKLASGAPSPATYHFGAQAIHGVVRFARSSDDRDEDQH